MFLSELSNTFYIFLNYLLICINCELITWSTVYESPIVRAPQPGWVRFCKNESVYDSFANQCPVGVFWDEGNDNQWDCVCTRGPWRRSAGWCTEEDTQRFTQGELTCFEPDPAEKPGLQAMYYFGDRFSAWDSGLPILLSDYRTGIPIRKGDLTSQWEIPSRNRKTPGVVIYRPREDWEVEDRLKSETKLCLRAPTSFNEETDGLFIYEVSKLFNSSGGSQKFQLSFTRGCYSWSERDNATWHDIVGENLWQKNMIVPPFDANTASDNCVQCMSQPIPPAPEADIDGQPLEEREEFTIYDLKDVGILKTEIDLQSERLGHYWAYRMLQNGTDYVVGDFQEIDILTKAAILAYEDCDKHHIPFQFYQYFIIMFKMLLSESFKKFPPRGPISEEYYAKINQMLDKCKDRKLDLKLTIGETCPALYEEFSFGVNDSQKINISSDYTSDKGRHDFLLEFIWRLKSFLHYKCFNEFKTESILHDIMQHQLESLFTEDLILRWYNPGNSYQMYNLIFENHFDLDTTMKNFQRCIAATHDMSQYPVWLKRPIDRPEISPKRGSAGSYATSRHKRSISSRKREADSDDYYNDEDVEEDAKAPNNLFGGSAACIKSIRTFMSESNRLPESKCW